MNANLIIEIKNIYLDHLKYLLIPHIYQGFFKMYNDSIEICQSKSEPLQVLEVFQQLIKNIPEWNKNIVSEETKRIKNKSKSSIYLDELIKKTFKIYLKIVLNLNDDDKIYENYSQKITSEEFIHKCYSNSAKTLYNCCYLMYHKYPPVELKKNQLLVKELILKEIENTMTSYLPLEDILNVTENKTFIKNDSELLIKINDSLQEIKTILREIDNKQSLNISHISKTIDKTIDYSTDDKNKKLLNIDNVLLSNKNFQITSNDELGLPRNELDKNNVVLKGTEISTNMIKLDDYINEKNTLKEIKNEQQTKIHDEYNATSEEDKMLKLNNIYNISDKKDNLNVMDNNKSIEEPLNNIIHNSDNNSKKEQTNNINNEIESKKDQTNNIINEIESKNKSVSIKNLSNKKNASQIELVQQKNSSIKDDKKSFTNIESIDNNAKIESPYIDLYNNNTFSNHSINYYLQKDDKSKMTKINKY